MLYLFNQQNRIDIRYKTSEVFIRFIMIFAIFAAQIHMESIGALIKTDLVKLA